MAITSRAARATGSAEFKLATGPHVGPGTYTARPSSTQSTKSCGVLFALQQDRGLNSYRVNDDPGPGHYFSLDESTRNDHSIAVSVFRSRSTRFDVSRSVRERSNAPGPGDYVLPSDFKKNDPLRKTSAAFALPTKRKVQSSHVPSIPAGDGIFGYDCVQGVLKPRSAPYNGKMPITGATQSSQPSAKGPAWSKSKTVRFTRDKPRTTSGRRRTRKRKCHHDPYATFIFNVVDPPEDLSVFESKRPRVQKSFGSKTPRFAVADNSVPGPGEYELMDDQHELMRTARASSVFRNAPRDSGSVSQTDGPGPGTYDLDPKAVTTAERYYTQADLGLTKQSPFLSNTERFVDDQELLGKPGPGTYIGWENAEIKRNIAVKYEKAPFGSRGDRFKGLKRPAHTPQPRKRKRKWFKKRKREVEREESVVGLETRPHFRPKSRPQTSGSQYKDGAVSAFRSQIDRFADSTLKQKEDIPPVGAYDLPTDWEKTSSVNSRISSSNPFGSQSQRFVELGLYQTPVPGPGTYSIERPLSSNTFFENQGTSSFTTRVKRFEDSNHSQTEMPGPGAYYDGTQSSTLVKKTHNVTYDEASSAWFE